MDKASAHLETGNFTECERLCRKALEAALAAPEGPGAAWTRTEDSPP